jgi:hypothetical protein
VSDTWGVCGMGGSVTGVCAPLVGGVVVVAGRVAASTAAGASCAANAVGRAGSGGYSSTDSESTSTLVYDVRALAET